MWLPIKPNNTRFWETCKQPWGGQWLFISKLKDTAHLSRDGPCLLILLQELKTQHMICRGNEKDTLLYEFCNHRTSNYRAPSGTYTSHSFTQTSEYLLCARQCTKYWDRRDERRWSTLEKLILIILWAGLEVLHWQVNVCELTTPSFLWQSW